MDRFKGKSGTALLLTVFSVLAFMGCTSSSEKPGTGDCVLVIPTEFYQEPGSDPVRSYYIKFSHEEQEYQIPEQKSGILTIRLNGPDNKLASVTSRVTNPKYSGKDFTSEYNLTLPYKSGHAVISSFKFIQKSVVEDGTTVTRFFITNTSEAERKSILDRI